MNKKVAKLVSFFTIVLIIGNMFAGCSGKTNDNAAASGTNPSAAEASSENTSTAKASDTSVYPLDTDVKLKVWERLSFTKGSNTGDTEYGKLLSQKTGINVEYLNPPLGKEKDSFNVMIASGDLPDIIKWQWGVASQYSGGANKALADGLALPLNDIMDKWAPNLKKVLQDNPAYDKGAKTDDGIYWGFPMIREDEYLMVFQGPVVRKDWLDDVGLQVPTTIDEWYTVLKAFKEKKGATAPLTYLEVPTTLLTCGGFIGAYGTIRDFFVDDAGKIKYGPLEPGYKDFLTTFKKWYDEGLLDKDFATIDNKTITAKITSGKTGATINNVGGGIGTYMNTMKEKDAKYSVVAAPYPVLEKGGRPMFGQREPAITGMFGVINPKSKNIEIAARFLDYGYSEEGRLMMNFGEEGVTYKMIDGYPTYTELVTKNPNGLVFSECLSLYVNGTNNCSIQDRRYMEQYLEYPQQKEAIPIWADTDAAKHLVPTNITLTEEEAAQYTKIMADINTYESEMYLKFIMGVEPLDNFDKFVDQLKKMDIDKAISIKQAALERFNKR